MKINEDNRLCNLIAKCLAYGRKVGIVSDDDNIACLDLLMRKDTSWKPSEEQMRGLKYFLDHHRPQRNAGTTAWKEFDSVDSLYNDLLKLK